ncbi:MAG: SpoIIE family protein phosphatase [Bacteroidales bacterium]
MLIAILGTINTIFTIYLVQERSEQLKKAILDKGIAAAQTGAKIMGEILENVADTKVYTLDQLFNDTLVPIPIEREVLKAYRKIPLSKINEIQKYHYSTGLDVYLDSLIGSIQDEFFKDPEVVFAVLCDKNGYTPTHNKNYNEPLVGNYSIDNEKSRSKRIYYDPVLNQNLTSPYLLDIYLRDTGEEMWKISAPVFVKGKHWGSFRIGFSMKKTEQAVMDLRIRLIILMTILLLISVVVINRATAWMMKPLDKLHKGVSKLASGDLSYRISIQTKDEIGDLAKAFNGMTDDLNLYINNLKETTASNERIKSELKLGKDIQRRMLPHVFPAFPERKEFDIYAIMEPAKEVAGDFFDFFFIDDDHFCFAISDVSGKGVPSALFMVIARTLLNAEAKRGYTIQKLIFNLNNALSKNNETSMFATFFCAIMNVKTGEIQMVNAGHNPPLAGDNKNGFEFVKIEQNIALGVLEDFEFTASDIKLNKGASILLYTDGITEAFNKNNEAFSDQRLLSVVNNYQTDGSFQLVQKIQQEIKNFTIDTEQSDDITILAVTYNGI